jgi:1-acyl-sn-glycerol-3-phosphate acyltransferase
VERPVYGLTHPKIWQVAPFLGAMGSQVGAVQAHPKMAIAAFRQGAHVLVYPGGAQDTFRPHRLRDKIYFANRKGFIKLALREGVPIVPLISWGAHDTLIVLGDCYEQARYLNKLGLPWLMNIDPEVFPIYLGLPWGISLGALPNIPLPTQIHTRVCEPITFEHYGRAWVKDEAYVEACYGQVVERMQADLDRLVAIA